MQKTTNSKQTIRTLLDTATAKGSGRVALEYVLSGKRKSLTYGEVAFAVSVYAEIFSKQGLIPRERPCALILENGPEWVESYLALAGTAIPVVPMDPKLRPAEVTFILKNSRARAVVTDVSHIPLLEKVLPDLPELASILIHAQEDEIVPVNVCGRLCVKIRERIAVEKYEAQSPSGHYAKTTPMPDDVAAIIYTSGTTGTPKGAMITHENFVSDAIGAIENVKVLRPSDRFFVVLPLFHAFSFTANMLLSLSLGARLQFVQSLRTISEDMKLYKPTVMMAVPLLVEKIAAKIDNGLRTNQWMLLFQAFHLRGLVKDIIRRKLGGKLRVIITGGAPCSVKTITLMRRFGVHLIEGYGLTEASPIVTISSPKDSRIGTIGKALSNIEVKIQDPNEQGIGELVVKGPIVMKGYLDLPEATAEALEGGYLHTGDLASIDPEGFITIRGRKKSLIVNREGKNIYPEEVEACISRATNLRDVLVLGYHDQGDVGEKVGVIIVPKEEDFHTPDGQQMSRKDIETAVRAIVQTQCGDLATYKHPRKIDIRFEPLERTPALKIARKRYQGSLDSF